MPTMTNPPDCSYCVDWRQPAGTHDLLGQVYRPCPYCIGTCPTCKGDGLLPADPSCLHCVAVRLATRELIPVICTTCYGVVDLLPRHLHPAGGTS